MPPESARAVARADLWGKLPDLIPVFVGLKGEKKIY